jgi:23S rRNA (cytidine1920-2'-O)/16S rRNA (cytidine1409-2'-O)-methyltransferase
MRRAVRLDAVVAAQTGITRSQARSLIMEGRVRLDGLIVTKAGHGTDPASNIEVESPRRFVGRGGEKLEAALDAFRIDVAGQTALDVGASTGGFTDCLLQRGAAAVTAVDVGYGQLDWRLRNDPRVTVRERTNFRLLGDDAFPGGFDLIVVDVSFISATAIVARARKYLRPNAAAIVLVKPQFEAGRSRLGGGGVVRDPDAHRAILREMREAFAGLSLFAVALCASPLRGPAGNREFFMELRAEGRPIDGARIDAIVDEGGAS